MQSINVTILNPLFFLAFFGTAVVALVVGILSIARWSEPGAGMMLIGVPALPRGFDCRDDDVQRPAQ